MAVTARSAARAPARTGPKPRLSREEIVDCALRLMDRAGPDALTFRAVARELDIAAGALANYFPSLADLRDHVAARVLADVRPLELRSRKQARTELVRFGMAMVETTQAHPYVLQLCGPESSSVVTRLLARSIKALMQVGFEAEHAVALVAIVGNLAHSFGIRDAFPRSPEVQARVAQVVSEEFGPEVPNVPSMDAGELHRRHLTLCVDGLLA